MISSGLASKKRATVTAAEGETRHWMAGKEADENDRILKMIKKRRKEKRRRKKGKEKKDDDVRR